MDGDIAAQSAGVPGQGSTFHLTVRVAGGRRCRRPHRSSPVDLAGRRALIVDDNATNRRILAAQLARWGIEVDAHESPHEALDRVEDGRPFDVAILDLHMPDLDGVAPRRRRSGRASADAARRS